MPIQRAHLDEALAAVNAKRPKDLPALLEDASEKGFVLSFPPRELPEGQCIDQDFTDIQWLLHEKGVTTSIVSGRQSEDERYHIAYEVVEW